MPTDAMVARLRAFGNRSRVDVLEFAPGTPIRERIMVLGDRWAYEQGRYSLDLADRLRPIRVGVAFDALDRAAREIESASDDLIRINEVLVQTLVSRDAQIVRMQHDLSEELSELLPQEVREARLLVLSEADTTTAWFAHHDTLPSDLVRIVAPLPADPVTPEPT